MNSENQKVALLIIDPQNDFCSKVGSLYIPGAEQDNQRLGEWILDNKREIDQIFVTMDSHYNLDISHPKFWINKEGNNPEPFTIIKSSDVIDGNWKPAYSFFNEGVTLMYLEKLEEQGDFEHCIWPEHCISGTWGQAIDTMVNGCLREWTLGGEDARFVRYITKGSHPMTEHFGAFKAQVALSNAPETHINVALIDHLSAFDVVYLAGQAKSHCVANTLKQIMELSPALVEKIIVLEDTMSNVPGFENIADSIFEKAKEMGVKFIATETINK